MQVNSIYEGLLTYTHTQTHRQTHLTLAGPTRLYDLLHSESGNVLAAHREQSAVRGLLWLVYKRISIVAANVTKAHGWYWTRARTFTDLHNCFNWSFFGYPKKKKKLTEACWCKKLIWY